MIFIIDIMSEPESGGEAYVIERRTHSGATVEEALQTARRNLRGPAGAYSFAMRTYKYGQEVGRWRASDVVPLG
jgi:hypothetical protein